MPLCSVSSLGLWGWGIRCSELEPPIFGETPFLIVSKGCTGSAEGLSPGPCCPGVIVLSHLYLSSVSSLPCSWLAQRREMMLPASFLHDLGKTSSSLPASTFSFKRWAMSFLNFLFICIIYLFYFIERVCVHAHGVGGAGQGKVEGERES